jgi:putative Mg2+ transporter-C (MgtC) family protein
LGLGSFHLALVLAFAVLFTNMVLRPLAYRLHPVLPEAIPAETLYELKLDCKVSAGAHIHALLLSTIARLPVMLHSIQGDQERHERANPHPRRDNDRRPEQRSY